MPDNSVDLELCRIETEMRMLRANVARDRAHLRRLAVDLLLNRILFLMEPEAMRVFDETRARYQPEKTTA